MTTETVTITNPEANPSLEDQAAKAGIDPKTLDSTSQSQGSGDRPSWLPAKFATPEDMAKSYAELEKKQSKPKDEPQGETNADAADETDEQSDETEVDPNDADAKAEAEKKAAEEAAKEATDKAGLDLEALSDKYWENGALEEADYEALAKAGYAKGLVDQFIAGQNAVQEATRQTVFAEAGGEQSYRDMTAWAKENYSEAEIEEYNEAVAGNATKRMTAVKALKARYAEENGSDPVRQVSARAGRGSTDVYESVAQLQTDMRNPKYHSDPAFRAKVEAKLGRSDIL